MRMVDHLVVLSIQRNDRGSYRAHSTFTLSEEGFSHASAPTGTHINARRAYNNTIEKAFTQALATSIVHYSTNNDISEAGSTIHFRYDNLSLEYYYELMYAWLHSSPPPPDPPHRVQNFPHGWASYSGHKLLMWSGVKQALCEKYKNDPVKLSEYCPVYMPMDYEGRYVTDSSEESKKGLDAYMVGHALRDLFDGYGGEDDRTCSYHFIVQERDACDTWIANEDEESFGYILRAIQNPRNYFEFIEDYYNLMYQRAGAESDFDACKAQNFLRATSRFNGITLDGIFGLESDDWGRYVWGPYCDKWGIPPESPPTCAATQAVVTAVEGGVDGVSITPEEGETLLEKVRIIRDEYLLESDRGLMYANLYATCSDEIISGILGNPDVTLAALYLIEDAAMKVDNLEFYLASGETPVDETFVALTTIILEELKSHTSQELLDSVSVVEDDLEIVQGMSVQEILEYFSWAQ